MDRRWDTSLRLLMVVLLATGGVSLGMRHAHPGGGRPHHHHGAGEIECLAEDHGGAPHHHDAYDAHDHKAVAAAPLHRHVFLLGFEITFPDSGQTGEDSQDTTSTTGKNMFMRLVSGDVVQPPTAASGVASTAELAPLELATIRLVHRPTARDGRMASALPRLCDSARHERSGVQLM